MRSIRMYGFEGSYYSMREGINSRMDEMQAAILSVKLKYLPDYIEQRRKIAEIYQQNLIEKAVPIRPADGVSHAYHLFVVKVPCRDNVQNELFRRGISTGIHYPYPIHLMPAYRFLGYKEGDLPHTEALAKNILSLPIYPELSDESVRKICEDLNDVLTQELLVENIQIYLSGKCQHDCHVYPLRWYNIYWTVLQHCPDH